MSYIRKEFPLSLTVGMNKYGDAFCFEAEGYAQTCLEDCGLQQFIAELPRWRLEDGTDGRYTSGVWKWEGNAVVRFYPEREDEPPHAELEGYDGYYKFVLKR